MLIIALIGLLLLGVLLITKGSDWMTDSLIPLADRLGTSYIAVASLIVSIMLSIPEIFVSLYAFFLGHGGISLGVIIGSIVCNIGLMTGLSAMIKPLEVDARVVVRDGIFAFVLALIVFVFGMDYRFDRSEGTVLLLLFVPYMLNVWFFEKWQSKREKQEEVREIKAKMDAIGLSLFRLKPGAYLFFIGAAALLFGSYLFSEGLIQLARQTGLSDILIGLTIGAIGPSIPNIASAVQGTRKNYTKIAITETFGSDIFTLTVTLGLLALLAPFAFDSRWLYFDIPTMIIMTTLMLLFILHGHHEGKPAVLRYEGAILFIVYCLILLANAVALS